MHNVREIRIYERALIQERPQKNWKDFSTAYQRRENSDEEFERFVQVLSRNMAQHVSA